jgi:hypothetical protein
MVDSTTTTKPSKAGITKEDIEGFAKLLQSLLKPLVALLTVAIPFLYVQKQQEDDISTNNACPVCTVLLLANAYYLLLFFLVIFIMCVCVFVCLFVFQNPGIHGCQEAIR